jgi:hypothetical protein
MRALVVAEWEIARAIIPPACQRIADDASTSRSPFSASAAARCNLGCRGDAAVAHIAGRPATDGPLERPVPEPAHAFSSKASYLGTPAAKTHQRGSWRGSQRASPPLPRRIDGEAGRLKMPVNAGDLVRLA